MSKNTPASSDHISDPLAILKRRIHTSQAAKTLIVEVRHALDAWGILDPDGMFREYSVVALAVAHNVLVGAGESGDLEEINNPAGYLIGCTKRIEHSMGLRNR